MPAQLRRAGAWQCRLDLLAPGSCPENVGVGRCLVVSIKARVASAATGMSPRHKSSQALPAPHILLRSIRLAVSCAVTGRTEMAKDSRELFPGDALPGRPARLLIESKAPRFDETPETFRKRPSSCGFHAPSA